MRSHRIEKYEVYLKDWHTYRYKRCVNLESVPQSAQLNGRLTMTGDQNGWGEYSRLVLKELETLATGIEGLRIQIGDLKSEIAELKAKEDKVKELSAWKDRIDEVASPSQIKEMQDMVKAHELFKTKAITMFAVVQVMMASLMAILKFFL